MLKCHLTVYEETQDIVGSQSWCDLADKIIGKDAQIQHCSLPLTRQKQHL